MLISSDVAAGVQPTINLGGCDFAFVESLAPIREANGIVREFNPQVRYAKAATTRLNKHGKGSFCEFRVSVSMGLMGVYALLVNGFVRYVGECEDLGRRFNTGYGTISPKNCFVGGQSTNCKINRRVLDATIAGECVDLYFYPTPRRKLVEQQILARYSPLWNG